MTSKCTGIMGRIFGHKWKPFTVDTLKHANLSARSAWAILPVYAANDFLDGSRIVCQRCGAVTGEKK